VRLDVPDLNPLYDNAAVFINPMKNGYGVKLKTIEAALHGLPIVSTDVGVEGSGLEAGIHFTLANDANTFAGAVREMLLDKDQAHATVERAQNFLVEHYGQGQHLTRLLLPASIFQSR
jgi:glycosyltransferase involved in cell wall biosynthesis